MRKEVILIMKAIRILGRNIRDGFKSVGRNLSLSIASISCITITLLIVGIALIASYNVENMTKLVKEDFTIVTFIDTSATNEQTLANRLLINFAKEQGFTLVSGNEEKDDNTDITNCLKFVKPMKKILMQMIVVLSGKS